ncbi:putative glycoside hydrolase [Peribacillus acanthi]|uniref:putative glycoside hydrolase n=1 Tax=Peribacillus acanthi TaxID=2171554 RepID=UPI001300B357|nr:putative glycoside hydrolase [Peribacillus acanthi]
MKISRALSLVLACISLFLLTGASNFSSPLNSVKNYTIYYGKVNEEILNKLSKMDMVIIEPHEFTKEQIQILREKGTIVLGYISLMELEKWNTDFVQKVIEEDYYYRNNEKIYIEKWDTYIMDISNPHYQQLLIDEIQVEIVDKGLDGVFFDTIGDIDDYFSKEPAAQKKLRDSYLQLLKSIKQTNPEKILVQNWGFETFKSDSYTFLDGLLWEDFRTRDLVKSDWGQKWINYFKLVEKRKRVAIFTVTPSKKDKQYSLNQGFTSFINKDDYYNELK